MSLLQKHRPPEGVVRRGQEIVEVEIALKRQDDRNSDPKTEKVEDRQDQQDQGV